MNEASGAVECLPADAVLAMTGYHADTSLLQRLGVPVDPASGIPAHDERTMATAVPGCYLAGVIASGNDANRLFIENARGHGDLIVRDLLEEGPRAVRARQAHQRNPATPMRCIMSVKALTAAGIELAPARPRMYDSASADVHASR